MEDISMHIRISILVLASVLTAALPIVSARQGAEGKERTVKLELREGKAIRTDSLTSNDPKDKRRGWICKTYAIELKAGRVYQIDMVSNKIDSYLRLETAEGKQIAEDDDSGGGINARIIYRPGKEGTHHIIATSFGGSPGEFTLTVQQKPQAPE
jgi:hypothetical protein